MANSTEQEDPSVTALTEVYAQILKGRYAAAEAALDFGELDEFLAKATVASAQDVQWLASAGRLTLVFAVSPSASTTS